MIMSLGSSGSPALSLPGVAVAAPALQPGDPATDVHTLAEWLDVPRGTLQRWAQEDNWPRRHTTTARGRRTLYSVDAARASYLQHVAAAEEKRAALDKRRPREASSCQGA